MGMGWRVVGDRTVFIRSPLGSRMRSPMGAFICKATKFLEIYTVPFYLFDGESYIVTGEAFLATQGTGELLISDGPDFDGVVVSQSITSWSDTSITFTFDDGMALSDIVWIKVIADNGQFDTKATSVVLIVSELHVGEVGGPDGGQSPELQACALSSSAYCGIAFSLIGTNFFGYAPSFTTSRAFGIRNGFLENSPGFSIFGGTSKQDIGYSYRDTISESESVPNQTGITWCSGTEGAFAIYASDQFTVGYEPKAGSCVGDFGWTDTEDVYIIPKHPLSVQILTPITSGEPPTAYHAARYPLNMSGVSLASEGDISNRIRWYISSPSVLWIGSGPALSYTFSANTYGLSALGENRQGQQRSADITLIAEPLEIESVNPTSGAEAGSTAVTITGKGFVSGMSVEFGGNPATSVVFVDIHTITCNTPAGAGTVDVEVIDGAFSDTLVNGYTYTGSDPISVTGCTPNTGAAAGGTAVTITGTGFIDPCLVSFGPSSATSVVVVNSTTITCVTPSGTGTVDVQVLRTSDFTSDTLVGGFTYT